MYAGAVADFAQGLDDVALGACELRPAVADQDPTDAEHFGAGGVEARRFDVQAQELGILEFGGG